MADQFVTIRINSDHDLSTSAMWTSLELLLLGHKSALADYILEAEVVEHRTKEGWSTTVGT